MRNHWLGFAAIGMMFGACLDAPVDVEERQQAIIGGTAASAGDYPTTVGLISNGLCTGTLVAPDLVLTAAHCLLPQLLGFSSQAEVTANMVVVLDATDLNGGGQQVSLAKTTPNPNFNQLGDNDIGLVRLSRSITDRTPTPINRFAADAPPGIRVDQVGYGVSEVGNQNSAGTLFAVTDKVTQSCAGVGPASDALLLCYSQADGTGKCEGDSGGPSYAVIGGIQKVVGVTSFGDQTCEQFGADTRVDAELEFLFAEAPELQCQADGACNDACGKAGLVIDPDCKACEGDGDCGGKLCVAGACVVGPGEPGGLGEACASESDCDSGLCATDADGNQCTVQCLSESDDCPDGFECLATGSKDVCWPKGGGCQVGGSSGGGAALLLLLVAISLLRRRRRS